MECPYTELELKMARLELNKKLSDEDLKKMEEFSARYPTTAKEINKAVAKENGITLDQLIESPNMELMTKRYQDARFKEILTFFKTDLGLTDKQAWGILVNCIR